MRTSARVTRRHIGELALTVGVFTVSCGVAAAPATTADSGGVTRTSEGGQVTVTVTWVGAQPAADSLTFKVVMDTHAVDLDGYDLRQLAALRTDSGREAGSADWTAPKGGHHREGTLVFPASVGGVPVVAPGARTLELVIRDVAGVPERRFTWPL